MSNYLAGQVGRAVSVALLDAGRTKRSISDETGIPYSTLNRKVAGKAEFSLSELLLIAEAIGTTPSALLPSDFRASVAAA